jgi:agmatinase
MLTLKQDKNFLAIDEKYSSLDNSKIVILPAPYEHTTSYGNGAAKGPEEILKASAFVEFYDDEFERELCFEYGIATLAPLNFNNLYDRDALNLIQNKVQELISLNKFVVTLGGEHTISTAPIAAYFEKYPDMSILHFDAHSDLRDVFENSKYSHACFMARVAEFFPNDRIVQVGIRAQCIEEAKFIKKNKIKTFYASALRKGRHSSFWQSEIVNKLGNEIYITFDLDYFDPAIMPATGTPEPDGFLYNETIEILREIKNEGKKIIGFDVVELAPIPYLHHPNLTAARLIYKILNFAFEMFER